MGAYPQVVDWNQDGKLDLVAGDTEGNVWFFRNGGTSNAPALQAGVKLAAGGKTITGTRPEYKRDASGQYRLEPKSGELMGIYSKLHVADADGDGLLDILVGQDSPGDPAANVVFYRNTGTAREPVLAAPMPLGAPIAGVSRPSPYLCDWDGDGKRDLLLGTERAQVLFLRNTGTEKQPAYAAPEQIALPGFDTACYRCRIAVADWNNDGKPDLLIGNRTGDRTGRERGGSVWLFLRK